jgi:hypothetical protein
VSEIAFPLAVEREIDRAVDLHLERELPLPRDRACVDWHVLRRDRIARRIVVRMFVSHRGRVESLRDAILAKGLRPIRVAVTDASGELLGNLLPRRNRTERLRITPLDRRLAAVAATLVCVAAGITGAQWFYERAEVKDEVERVRALAVTTESLTRRLRDESAPATALIGIMRKPDAVDVLTSLTSSAPQDSWAYELDIKPAQAGGYQVKFGGFAPAATMLVDTLEKTPQFENVRLVTAASAGLGTTRDQLQLTARFTQQ